MAPTPKTVRFQVVGVTFAPGYPDTIHRLNSYEHGDVEGLAVVLVRDPENTHDPNAVQIHVPAIGQMIGHAPRSAARYLARRLHDGALFSAEIEQCRIHPDHLDRPGIDILCTERTAP